ncbi:LysR family transcriptional regulator [Mesobacillus maritimus]|uniref:LysR family transcriptional regulator n=1 Tax=Mesobacillus maritimus TaxID=1643336 RepID=UPI00203D1C4B|nr:LysR family transcriptional regulator [Mesobacillus maritimus]MCM3671339.1 LysR family transcriptional regulator [Mesobacillus maritimus]
MDIRQLHYFREIVRQGSISKAAEVLHIAQPPLSQLLKKLETELGTTLIHRYRQKWELTETGEIYYQYAEIMLRQTEDVRQRILEIEQGVSGTINIGVSSACSNLLIDYVSMLRSQFPNVKIKIISGDSEELLKKLEQREIHVALLLRPGNTEHYLMKNVNKQPYVVIIPTHWDSKFSSEKLTFDQLASFPIIMLGAMEGHFFYENILKAFDERGLKPNIVIECKNLTMVVALVSRGLGLSIIPRMDYASPYSEHTTLLDLEGFEFSMEPVFLRLKDEPIPKAASQFWEMIESFFT